MIIIFCISTPLLLVRQRVSVSQQLFANHSNQDGPHEKKPYCNLVHSVVLFLLEAGEGEGGAGVDCLTSIKKISSSVFSDFFFSQAVTGHVNTNNTPIFSLFFPCFQHLMHRMLLALYIMTFLVMLQIWNGCLKEHFFHVLVKMSWVASSVSCWLGLWAHGAMDSWWDYLYMYVFPAHYSQFSLRAYHKKSDCKTNKTWNVVVV